MTMPSRFNADVHIDTSTFQQRTPPNWKFEDQFEFYGFWLANEEYVVSNALTGVMDLLETTMKVLSGTSGEGLPFGEEDPSFQRYFRTGDLDQVGAVFQRILGILGAPGTSAIRQCIEASKLLLIYGDGPNSNRNCADETRGVFAYYNAFEDSNKIPRSYLAFCKRFFDSYKAHKPMGWDVSISYVDSTKMGTSIDIADPRQLPEAESGASIVLHGEPLEPQHTTCETNIGLELLHWSDITKPVVPNQIEDLILVRPDTGEERTAYRSFYGAKVKDSAWKAKQPPVSAGQNMLEIHALLMILPRRRTQTRMSTWYWKYSTAIDTANSHGKTLQTYMVSLRAPTFHPLRLEMRVEVTGAPSKRADCQKEDSMAAACSE